MAFVSMYTKHTVNTSKYLSGSNKTLKQTANQDARRTARICTRTSWRGIHVYLASRRAPPRFQILWQPV